MVDRERLAVPAIAADVLEPGLLEPTAQLRERKHADRKVESSRLSVTDDDPLAPGKAGEGVVRVQVEHEVAVALQDRLWAVVPHDPVSVVQIDEKTTTRFQRPERGRKNGTIALVVEVTKRREPGKRAIELSPPGRVAHVRLDVVDLDPARGRVLSCQLEESGRSVKPRHLGAALGEAVRDPPVAASEIEHLQPCLQLEQAPDQINLLLTSLVREQLRVEVEVIVVERLLALHPLTIAPRGAAVAPKPPLDTTARSAPGQSRCRTSNKGRQAWWDRNR